MSRYVIRMFPWSSVLVLCTIETWGSNLNDSNFQASINNNAIPGVLYQVDDFLNGIGAISGVSSAKVSGVECTVAFKDSRGVDRCVLSSGNYAFTSFVPACGNDVVTQYTIICFSNADCTGTRVCNNGGTARCSCGMDSLA